MLSLLLQLGLFYDIVLIHEVQSIRSNTDTISSFFRKRSRGNKTEYRFKRSRDHHEMLAAAENIHESALAPNLSLVTPASPQPSLLPATDQMPPVEQQQPAPRINRCLSFHGEQQREESQGQQSPLSPSTSTAISDSPEGGDFLSDGPAAAEAAEAPPPAPGDVPSDAFVALCERVGTVVDGEVFCPIAHLADRAPCGKITRFRCNIAIRCALHGDCRLIRSAARVSEAQLIRWLYRGPVWGPGLDWKELGRRHKQVRLEEP
jgi:hypothetical protein